MVSALLAFAMAVFLLPTAVFAQNINLPGSSSLKIHRYLAESYAQDDLPNNGTEIMTGIPDKTPVAGITFTLYQLNNPQGAAISGETAHAYIIEGSAQTAATGSDGVAVFENLENGYYFVVESNSFGREQGSTESKYYMPVASFVLKLPMENPAGNGWLDEVHVYPKSQSMMIDKFINGAGNADPDFTTANAAKSRSVFADSKFGWTVEAIIPTDIGTSGRTYSIVDELPANSAFDLDSVQVFTAPDTDTPTKNCEKLKLNQDYTLAPNAANSFTFTLTQAGREKLQGLAENDDVPVKWIRIKYDAALKRTAEQGVALGAQATMHYIVTSDVVSAAETAGNLRVSLLAAGTDTEAEKLAATTITRRVTNPPEVHSGQVKLYKYDAVDKTKTLSGAVFGIAATKAEAAAGSFIQTGTTNSKGELVFPGLAYGAAGDSVQQNSSNTTFWITEVTAPSGYKKLGDAFEVTFDHHFSQADSQYYFATLQIYNQPNPDATAKPAGGTAIQTGDSRLPIFVPIVALLAGVLLLVLVWKRFRKGN